MQYNPRTASKRGLEIGTPVYFKFDKHETDRKSIHLGSYLMRGLLSNDPTQNESLYVKLTPPQLTCIEADAQSPALQHTEIFTAREIVGILNTMVKMDHEYLEEDAISEIDTIANTNAGNAALLYFVECEVMYRESVK